MSVSVEQIKAQLQEKKEEFLSKRAKQEMQINSWGQKVQELDGVILKDVQLPEVITLQALVPELYMENPNMETYIKQVTSLNTLISNVNDAVAKYVQNIYTAYVKTSLSVPTLAEMRVQLRELNQMFLNNRAKQEVAISAWGEKLVKVDKALLEGIELPEVITLQTLVPEAYAEAPREDVYLAQLNKANELINAVNEVAAKNLEKAQAVLREYKGFSA